MTSDNSPRSHLSDPEYQILHNCIVVMACIDMDKIQAAALNAGILSNPRSVSPRESVLLLLVILYRFLTFSLFFHQSQFHPVLM